MIVSRETMEEHQLPILYVIARAKPVAIRTPVLRIATSGFALLAITAENRGGCVFFRVSRETMGKLS